MSRKNITSPLASIARYCIDHPVLANLMMILIVICGLVSVLRMNRQFFPDFNIDTAVVSVVWPGSTSEEVLSSVVSPTENALFGLKDMVSMRSTSSENRAQIVMEFASNTDMSERLQDIRDRLADVDYPDESEAPVVFQPPSREENMRVIIYGPSQISDLIEFSYMAERDLLSSGVDDIDMQGVSKRQISLELDPYTMHQYGLSAVDVGRNINRNVENVPLGSLGRGVNDRSLSLSVDHQKSYHFDHLTMNNSDKKAFRAEDVVSVKNDISYGESRVYYKDQPAVSFAISRLLGSDNDAFSLAEKVNAWIESVDRLWPSDVLNVEVYNASWQLVSQRIDLIIKNGFSGFILIFLVLFFFLNVRMAFWVALGVPISVFGALFFLYLNGGSINFLSTFAFLMAFGIIVDDTIVVAEQAYSEYQRGLSVYESVNNAVNLMFAPIMASSMTTIAAFMPLLMMQGLFGKILKDIPLVIIVVICASLLECFFILPHHLKGSLGRMGTTSPIRTNINKTISMFQYTWFKNTLVYLSRYAYLTITAGVLIVAVPFLLLLSGRVGFDFFPSPPDKILFLDAQFLPGTDQDTMKSYLNFAEQKLKEVDDGIYQENGERLVQKAIQFLGYRSPEGGALSLGSSMNQTEVSMIMSLSNPDERTTTNKTLINRWKEALSVYQNPHLVQFSISTPKAGPPGADIRLLLKGQDLIEMKNAAEAMKIMLSGYRGIVNIKDSMPYGKAEYQLTLTPLARSLGLGSAELSSQVSASFYGMEVITNPSFGESIEVRVQISDTSQQSFQVLPSLPIKLADGKMMPLSALVDIELKNSFYEYNRYNGDLYIEVSADVDPEIVYLNDALSEIENSVLPAITDQYDVTFSNEEQSRYENEAIGEMMYGSVIGLCLMYLVLAWVSRSYLWPMVVMIVIPFGLSGALLGHYLIGIPLTLLSIFGLFGLTGIVVNAAIILLNRYQLERANGLSAYDAIINATCQRLRAVVLTTITTIAGLIPLMLETSLQAQFLIPMVVSLSFGLAMATILILFVLPCIMVLVND